MQEYSAPDADVPGYSPSLRTSGPRLAALVLLLSGWILGLLAIVLLNSITQRTVFVLAGIGVEGIGIALLVRSHMPLRRRD